MIFAFNGKVFDTEKATLLAKVKKWYPINNWIMEKMYGGRYGRLFECDLYVSKNGAYLLVHKEDFDTYIGQKIDEAEARELLLDYDYKAYTKQFGEPDEL
jgi:hypothetical protein